MVYALERLVNARKHFCGCYDGFINEPCRALLGYCDCFPPFTKLSKAGVPGHLAAIIFLIVTL